MRAIDYFEKGTEAFAERCAIIDGATRCSYRELREATLRIAQALWASGLRTEDRVAIYSPNDWRVLSCMLGLLRARAVWVPINYRNAIDANVEYLNYARERAGRDRMGRCAGESRSLGWTGAHGRDHRSGEGRAGDESCLGHDDRNGEPLLEVR